MAVSLFAAMAETTPAKAQAGSKAKPSSSSDPCKPGMEALASGDVLKAIKALNSCLEQVPADRAAWVALGNACLEAGRFSPAADAFARAQKLKPGNAEVLASYLEALEGAGRRSERIPVFRALLAHRPSDRKLAENFLSALEAEGPGKYPEDYSTVLETLSANPDANPIYSEKLADAYLKRKLFEKAEAEYRGLLARRPESSEYWAGLGASQAETNPEAAAECYRKAALFSDQASQRTAYMGEFNRISRNRGASKAHASEPLPTIAAVAPPASPRGEPAKPFDAKAYQDSIFKVEMEKRKAEVRKANEAALVAATEKKNKDEEEKTSKAEQKKLAKVEKERLAKAHADSVAQAESARLARAEQEKKFKAEQERLAKARADSLAKVEVARVDAEKKAKAEQEKLAKGEKERLAKARADSLARVEAERVARLEAEKKAKAESERAAKARADSLAKVEVARVEAEKKAKAEQERLAKMEKERLAKARADSLARAETERVSRVEAEKKAKAESERAAKARADSLAKVEVARVEAEKKAKAEQERLAKMEKERLAKVRADSLAKAEAERVARVEAEKKAKAESERAAKAHADSLAKVEVARVEAEKKAKAEQERLAKMEKERLAKARADSLARAEAERVARVEAERKAKVRADSLARIEMERLAKVRADSLARVEAERIARAEAEKKSRHERAIAFAQQGRADSAVVLFKRVLAESPDSESYYWAGRANLDQKQWDKALSFLSKAPVAKTDLGALKGRALMGKGKFPEALAEIEGQYKKTKEAGLLEDLYVLKKKTGDEAGAMAYLEKLAEVRPRDLKIEEELAVYFWKHGDKAKALDRYGRVWSIEPSHGEANYRLGLDWSAQGVQDRAVPFLERAVTVFPERGDAWKALGKGRAALGRRDEAWAAYKKAQTLLPQDAEIARGKVALAKSTGREPDLNEAYRDLLKLAPQDAEASMGLAKLRFKAGDYPEAEKLFRIACPGSKDGAAWSQYGHALRENKKANESVAALLKAVELGEGGVPLRQELAGALFETGSVDQADAMAKEMSKSRPGDAEPWFLLGRIAMSRQQVVVAEEYYRKASHLKPDNGRYAEALARLFMDKDDYKQALSTLVPAEAGLSADGKLMLADCQGASGDWTRALDIYVQLEKQAPSAHVLSRKIDLLVRMGQGNRALEAAIGSPYGGKTEVQFSLAKAQIALAQSHILKGDLETAASLMNKVISSDNHNPEYHLQLGIAYYLQERYKKAMGEFSDALGYRQDYPEALYRKGMCLVKLERAAEAEDFFVELSQHADTVWKARGLYGRALVFESQGKWEAVQHHLELSIAAHPTSDAMAYMSRVSLRLAKPEEAEEWARRALDKDHGNEEATLAMAEALSARKKYPEAIVVAQQALRLKPLSCDLLVQTAKLSYQAGRMDSTMSSSDLAIRTCPQEPMGYYYAGLVQHGAKKPEEAKRYFKSYAKLGGDKKLIPE